jgi:hypothetical protein
MPSPGLFLEDVAHPTMLPVEALRVNAIKLPYAARQVGLGVFQQEVVMVVHQAVGVQLSVEPIDDRGQDSQEVLPVLVIEVDCLSAPPGEATWCRAPRNSMRGGLAIYLD